MGNFLNLFSKGESCQLLINLEGKHVSRYQFFKTLLDHNHGALSLIADLEQMYYSGRPFSLVDVRKKVQDLSDELKTLLTAFHKLSKEKYPALSEVFQNLKDHLSAELNPNPTFPFQDLVLPLEKVDSEKVILVGAKAGNLSVIKNILHLPVPGGFAVIAPAYQKFMEDNKLAKSIEIELSQFDPDDSKGLERISRTIQTLTEYDRPSLEKKLDQLGRLLACSRLLDMALSGQGDIERLTDLFFKEEYDFLIGPQQERIEGFYVRNGDWMTLNENGRTVYLQDGSKSGFF
jgi:pyruvate, water dikinase